MRGLDAEPLNLATSFGTAMHQLLSLVTRRFANRDGQCFDLQKKFCQSRPSRERGTHKNSLIRVSSDDPELACAPRGHAGGSPLSFAAGFVASARVGAIQISCSLALALGWMLLEKKWDVVQLQFLSKHTAFFNSPRPQLLTITLRRLAEKYATSLNATVVTEEMLGHQGRPRLPERITHPQIARLGRSQADGFDQHAVT